MTRFVARDSKEDYRIVGIFEVEDLEDGPDFDTATALAMERFDCYTVETEAIADPEDVAGFLLKQARQAKDQAEAVVADVNVRIEKMLEMAGFAAEMAEARERLAEARSAENAAYTELREVLLGKHAETGDKQFKTGTVGVYKVYNYDTDTALRYVVDHNLYGCAKLDTTAFNKLVGAMGGKIALDEQRLVAEEDTEARAKIKADLSGVEF